MPVVGIKTPDNVHFVATTWNSGLKDAVEASRCVLVPSLWSAPVEGALIKSLALSKMVAVVDIATAFSSELPEGAVLRLPSNTALAAQVLHDAIGRESMFESNGANWLRESGSWNQKCVRRIIDTVNAE